jgi:hypothetical protein
MSVITRDRREPRGDETPEEDPDRMRRRADVRLRIAKRQLLERRAEELERRVAELDAEAEAAAEAHRLACEPLQAELERVEGQIAAKMAARQPVPAALEERRRELITAVDDANTTLSDAVERVKRLKVAPADEAEALRFKAAAQSTLEQDLATAPLVNPALELEAFTAQQTMDWLAARVAAARKMIAKNVSAAREADLRRDSREATRCRARNTKWIAEAAAASAALEAAKQAAEAAHQALVDE